MEPSYLANLLSPVTLLLLINAFFMIFVSSFAWRCFFNLSYVQDRIQQSRLAKHPLLVKATLLMPIVSIIPTVLLRGHNTLLIIFKKLVGLGLFFSILTLLTLKTINTVYLLLPSGSIHSPKVMHTLVMYSFIGMMIALVGLFALSRTDKNNTHKGLGTFGCFIAYLCMLYVFYVIILMGTVVTSLNTFYYNITNPIIWILLFLLHFIFVATAVSAKNRWPLLLLLGYIALAVGFRN